MNTIKVLSFVLLNMVSAHVLCSSFGKPQGEEKVNLFVTFNNCVADSGLASGPGFSVWVEYKDKTILFDTGSNYSMLLENMEKEGLNILQITDIFISHNHWDHIYGIVGIAGARNFDVNTFIPKSSVEAITQQLPRLKYASVESFQQLYPGIWSTGGMESKFLNTSIYEQSLILDQPDGLVVIVGCSHPGIETIVGTIKTHFPGKAIKLLIGGLHLERKSPDELKQLSDNLKKEGVKSIAPSHCTGDAAINFFRKEWGSSFIQLFLGNEIIIDKNICFCK